VSSHDRTFAEPPLGTPAASAPHLLAVVFTDVVGFSAHMQRDEPGTIRRVQADIATLRQACAAHAGECLDVMGDGVMLSFRSASNAVAFASEVQQHFLKRNAAIREDERLQHRIGVHLGDVFRTQNGIAGDGVNIAARLEGVAPPGAIAVSQAVYDTVKGKLPLRAVFAGPQPLKNIRGPVLVWHLFPPGIGLPPASLGLRLPVRRALVLGSVVVAATAGAGAYWWRRRPGAAGADPKSIAVLPFTSAGGDQDAEAFADGMHEDLLTQLALLGNLKVVSRTSVMEYRKTAKNVRQIGGELGVAALVEGSVRRAAGRVRVSAQLIDAAADQHLWARTFDRELRDIFAVQSELAGEIANALQISLTANEELRLARRPTDNLQAYELFLKHQQMAQAMQGRVRSISGVLERIVPLEQAVRLDPKFALAWAQLAAEHSRARGYRQDDRPQEHVDRAREAIARAHALLGDDPQVSIAQAEVFLHALDDQRSAARTYDAVLAQAPWNVEALDGQASVLNELGESRRAVELLERAQSVDPRHMQSLIRLAGTYERFRHFDRTLGLRKRSIDLRPGDLELQARYHYLQYVATGSWATYDAWRATVPKDAERDFARVRNADMARALSRRDWKESHRLTDVDVDDSRRITASDQVGNAWEHALVFWAEGATQEATERARWALEKLATLANADLDAVHAELLALLGRRDEAFAAFERALQKHYKGGNQFNIERVRYTVLYLHALLGDTERVVTELPRHIQRPGFEIYDEIVDPRLMRASHDPRVVALLHAPQSNAPLALDTPYRPPGG
jgi:adenylate cyclase